MGWKFGQGIGPRLNKHEKNKQKQELKSRSIKIYGCSLPDGNLDNQLPNYIVHSSGSDTENDSDNFDDITFAPDDYEPYTVKPKDNFFGIGYSGLDRRPVLSSHVELFEPSQFAVKDKSKRFSIRGQVCYFFIVFC